MSAREYEAALRRAFVTHRCDFVIIDSARQRFQIAGVNYGMTRGWLSCEEKVIDEQDTQLRYRLTNKGRLHFGLPPKVTP